MKSEITIALVGNPNCGKTTLFNSFTGAKQHVGNWAGVTVEKKEGTMTFKGKKIKVVDLPGTYSLGAYSEDEIVARNFILEEKPDVIINVIDSTNIERNLYLTVQLLEMSSNVVLAMNMMDEAKNKGINIDLNKISKGLGIDAISTVATKNVGINELLECALKKAQSDNKIDKEFEYGKDLSSKLSMIEKNMEDEKFNIGYPKKWTAMKLLENDSYIVDKVKEQTSGEKILNFIKNIQDSLEKTYSLDCETLVVDRRYSLISDIVTKAIERMENANEETLSDKIDKVVTNRWLGIPIFAIIMFLMYQVTMTFGNDFLGGYIDEGFGGLGEWAGPALASMGASELFTSFIVDGLIGGMGSVLVFLPMIFTMYFIISILEDTGYMSRAAYVMDRFMRSIGLHGKTAISMIIGSGCNIAGIMSTRTMESKKDRMIAILINPFISCGARLPVYALFAGAFFGDKKIGFFSAAGVVIFSLYALGIAVAIMMSKIFSKTLFKGESSYFVMELPPYRVPTVKSVFIHMWEKAASFVKKAGTIIFGVVVVVWLLSNLPFGVEPSSRNSILGQIGSLIAPIFKPAGFGTWQAGVALFTGILAKETVVATLGTVYAVGEGAKLITSIQQAFTPLSAYSFMVMTLLYTPCIAAIGAIRRETNSRKWAWFTIVYTFVVGWIFAVLVYQIGSLLGF